jgi:hypothetical protein
VTGVDEQIAEALAESRAERAIQGRRVLAFNPSSSTVQPQELHPDDVILVPAEVFRRLDAAGDVLLWQRDLKIDARELLAVSWASSPSRQGSRRRRS